jgi:hypothetical protein
VPGIDDELDAAHKGYDQQPKNLLFEYALSAAAKIDPLYGVVKAITDHFSDAGARERVEALLCSLESVLRWHGKRIDELRDRVDSPEFVETLIVAVDHTTRTSNMRKIQRFADLLGYELAEGAGDHKAWEDAAAYIRDLAELGEADMQALRIVRSVEPELKNQTQHAFNPEPYTNRLKGMLGQEDIAAAEFYPRCARLSGFGLAVEIQSNDPRQLPGQHCFHLTSRGTRLLAMLQEAGK